LFNNFKTKNCAVGVFLIESFEHKIWPFLPWAVLHALHGNLTSMFNILDHPSASLKIKTIPGGIVLVQHIKVQDWGTISHMYVCTFDTNFQWANENDDKRTLSLAC